MDYQKKITPAKYGTIREEVIQEFGIGMSPHNNYVVITSSGFEPQVAAFNLAQPGLGTVNSGILVWENNSSELVEIAVDPHPHHNSNRAITDGDFSLILEPGQSKAITITRAGTYTYHNEGNLLQTGTIIVE